MKSLRIHPLPNKQLASWGQLVTVIWGQMYEPFACLLSKNLHRGHWHVREMQCSHWTREDVQSKISQTKLTINQSLCGFKCNLTLSCCPQMGLNITLLVLISLHHHITTSEQRNTVRFFFYCLHENVNVHSTVGHLNLDAIALTHCRSLLIFTQPFMDACSWYISIKTIWPAAANKQRAYNKSSFVQQTEK